MNGTEYFIYAINDIYNDSTRGLVCGIGCDGTVYYIYAINSTFSDNTTRGMFAVLQSLELVH